MPHLAIVQVGKQGASSTYIRMKMQAAEQCGIRATHVQLPEDADEHAISAEVRRLNEDDSVDGILVQLPLGDHISADAERRITELVQPDKDVDGFGELFRHVSLSEIGTSTVQSRALAGMSNGTLVCCLPGSTNACRTAWNKILVEQLDSRTKPCNFVPHLKAAAVDNCGPRS